MIITFLYQIQGIRYYGKYVGYLSDDYEEGLDIELKNIIYPEIANYYDTEDPSDVQIGVLFSSRNGSDYFSEEEKTVFGLLYLNWSNEPKEVFIHGNKIVENKKN